MSQATGERLQGHIKWFNVLKGFGFIIPATSGPDVFVHVSGLDKQDFRQGEKVKEGLKVSYELSPDRIGRITGVRVQSEE